ncbi:hypothetical protein [Aequorivita antarctica]|uniref:Lipoprotein n=1 Tax=Aequorivita antarctica TaxID=153266 RepID=A0A5C6Z110_9FLAO|nr:hypothetical protein [Aequorivita antarctica]TXD73137.1 hypothetical protein ESU54_08340 [Aequorivita antarctica]SRX74892.1 hypothetical protein AEQU3_01879 [Aequorivita antarctica]
MKITPFRLIVSFLAMGIFLFTSCNKDENDSSEEVNFSSDNSMRAAKTDNVTEATFNIIEQAFVENETGGRGITQFSLFSDCTTITVEMQGNVFTILLDFGNSCTLNNGNVVSGSILLEYGPLVSGTYTVNYTFQNFVINGNGVSGGGSILYEIANQNDNPQSTVTESITVSFPNTTVTGTRNGTRISEWVEGVGSGTWLDNVYHINGNWQTKFTNGFERSGEVTETLVYKTACPYVVDGRLEVTQDGLTAAIDFGDGECDNMAVFIYNGQEYPFIMN